MVGSARGLITGSARIVGGGEVAFGTFPYYGIPDQPSCGGTLVHEDILVSAAHCAGSFRRREIYLGGVKRNGDDAKETIRAVAEIMHPEFDSKTLKNDVMLVQLASASSLPVVALNEQFRSVSAKDELYVIGYGDTTYGGSGSAKLLGVEVPFVDHEICDGKKAYDGEVLDDYMFCAGAEGVDACQGDSGGPLFRTLPDSTLEIVGIVSWGRLCGSPRFPGVYTRISKVSQFIKNGVCELSANPPIECFNESESNLSQTSNAGDLCENSGRLQVNGSPVLGTTKGKYTEGLEFCRSRITGGGVWYSFVGTGGLVEASTCSPNTKFDTRLSILTGGCSSLVCLQKDDDSCGLQSVVQVPTVVGEMYYVLVHGFGESEGEFELNVKEITGQPSLAPASPTPRPTAIVPQNNDCADAVWINIDSTTSGTTSGATIDEGLTCSDGPYSAPGVWYRFEGSGEEISADTCSGADFDTQLALFQGNDCADLVCIGTNDDGGKSCGMGSTVAFPSAKGTTYHILVHGYGKNVSGQFDLRLETVKPTPAPNPAPLLTSFEDITDFDCDKGPLLCFLILILRAATVFLSSLF